ncbi:MAG: hypothetical protein LT102_10305 [Burkholderiaceae bacterium]|nr:hypothetical protein [Burkholderiaceae bacterium]
MTILHERMHLIERFRDDFEAFRTGAGEGKYTTGRMAEMGTPIDTTRTMTMITIITTATTRSIGMRLCASV